MDRVIGKLIFNDAKLYKKNYYRGKLHLVKV